MPANYFLVTSMTNDELVDWFDVDIKNPKAVIEYLSEWHTPDTERDSIACRGTVTDDYLARFRYSDRWIWGGTEYLLAADNLFASDASQYLYCRVSD